MRVPLILFIGIVLSVTPAFAGDVAITPNRLELVLQPGEDYTTVIQVIHTSAGGDDTKPVRIGIKTEDWDLDSRGNMSYISTEPMPWSARPWIVFTPGEQEIFPGQTARIRFSVIVPEDAKPGEYRAALIAHPRTPYVPVEADQRRVSFQFRLASIIYVRVADIEAATEFVNLKMVPKDGETIIEPEFANTGGVHLRFHDSFKLYSIMENGVDESGEPIYEERLVCSGSSQEAGVILPGGHRFFQRQIPCQLVPGRYRVVYRADAGDELPIFEGERDFFYPLDKEVVDAEQETDPISVNRPQNDSD